MHQNEPHFTADALHRPGGPLDTNRIRDRLIVIIGDNVSPFGDAARWELYDAALGILSEFVLIPKSEHHISPNVLRLAASDIERQGTGWGKLPRSLPGFLRDLADVMDPPVDEADVEALADLMDDIEAENIYDHHELARRLLQTGQVQVSRDDG